MTCCLLSFIFQSVVSLLEMIEYYKSTCKLNLAYNPKIKIRGWQAVSRTLKKVQYYSKKLKGIYWNQNKSATQIAPTLYIITPDY